MAIYTVYAPNMRTSAQLLNDHALSEKVVFIKEKMPWLALLFTPFWLLLHRLWLGFGLYLLVLFAVSGVLYALNAGQLAISLAEGLVSLLFALEAPTLQSAALKRRGYQHVASVVADGQEAAELKFFTHSSFPAARTGEPSQVLGVFPPAVSSASY